MVEGLILIAQVALIVCVAIAYAENRRAQQQCIKRNKKLREKLNLLTTKENHHVRISE